MHASGEAASNPYAPLGGSHSVTDADAMPVHASVSEARSCNETACSAHTGDTLQSL